MNINSVLSGEFSIKQTYTDNIIKLIDDGNTVPFIARYRKELTGSCDDQVLRQFSDRLVYLRNMETRKEAIITSITEQEKMTDEIMADITSAATLARLEDIYRPYKPKKRTRATIAKERGLEPLASKIIAGEITAENIDSTLNSYIEQEKGVADATAALAGARDIVAEVVSDDPKIRETLKNLFSKTALITTKKAKEEDSVYAMYYSYSELVSKIPSHRILAINRGEKDGFLKVSVDVDETKALQFTCIPYLKGDKTNRDIIIDAGTDSYKRLIYPSIEREIRSSLTEISVESAIANFGVNLKSLLMGPPIKNKVVLAVDPAYRTGCKLAVVDGTGKVLSTGVIYPTPPQSKVEEATKTVLSLIKKYGVTIIAIGNGTASKESEIFIVDVIKKSESPVQYMMVNEAGASVYSASKLGAEEFPQFDVSLRSAVSIARRLQDPLSELVKIDPRSIGVGQYQHDMPSKQLDSSLSGVVESCVNSVGVDINTASAPLLSYVAGLSMAVAKNIIKYREENGILTDRKQLLKIAKLGPKAFLQCAGFLRITDGKNPLDNTSVHPEAYKATLTLLDLLGYKSADIESHNLADIDSVIESQDKVELATKCGVGVPTLNDIITEVKKPGRDIRDELPPPMLRSDIMDLKDLKPGMELKGTVRNAIDFGVFVDIGVHQDGLVHISEITNRFIKHPSEVVKVGDVVTVYVLSVDTQKKRISLSMKRKPK